MERGVLWLRSPINVSMETYQSICSFWMYHVYWSLHGQFRSEMSSVYSNYFRLISKGNLWYILFAFKKELHLMSWNQALSLRTSKRPLNLWFSVTIARFSYAVLSPGISVNRLSVWGPTGIRIKMVLLSKCLLMCFFFFFLVFLH